MTASAQQDLTTAVPAGTWVADTVHSSVGFSVKYVVAAFNGEFKKFDAKLEDGKLVGTVQVPSISVKDENLAGHLQSPDFFDTEKYPELTFESTNVTLGGDEVVVAGDLTINGRTNPVEGRGTINGPIETPHGATQIALSLEAIVDRTQFGLNWNADLPAGGKALADDVTLKIDLYLNQA